MNNLNLEKIEFLSRIFIIMIAILYVFGFMVVMRHYSYYSVVAISLIKPQYLLAGIWLCLLPLVSYLLFNFCMESLYRLIQRIIKNNFELKLDDGYEKFGTYLGIILLIVFDVSISSIITFLIAVSFIPELGIFLSVSSLKPMLYVTLWLIGTFIFGFGCNEQIKEYQTKNDLPFKYLHLKSIVTYFLIANIMFMGYMNIFSKYYYPYIPLALGGGRPAIVRFLTNNSNNKEVMNVSNHMSMPINENEQYKLILITDKSYVILKEINGQEKALEFSKDLVNSIIYISE